MGGFGEVIKYLYEKFLLRDVLSFITPGAIVVLTAFFLFSPWDLHLPLPFYIPWPLYIPLFGLFFLIGFAIQCFGEMFGLIRHTPKEDKNNRCKRFEIWNCKKWGNDSEGWWHEAHKDIAKFAEKTSRPVLEWARDRHERFIVLKQMCANGSLAIAMAGLLIIINHWFHQASFVLSFIVALLLIVSLFWGCRVHTLKENDWRNVVISMHKRSN